MFVHKKKFDFFLFSSLLDVIKGDEVKCMRRAFVTEKVKVMVALRDEDAAVVERSAGG